MNELERSLKSTNPPRTPSTLKKSQVPPCKTTASLPPWAERHPNFLAGDIHCQPVIHNHSDRYYIMKQDLLIKGADHAAWDNGVTDFLVEEAQAFREVNALGRAD